MDKSTRTAVIIYIAVIFIFSLTGFFIWKKSFSGFSGLDLGLGGKLSVPSAKAFYLATEGETNLIRGTEIEKITQADSFKSINTGDQLNVNSDARGILLLADGSFMFLEPGTKLKIDALSISLKKKNMDFNGILEDGRIWVKTVDTILNNNLKFTTDNAKIETKSGTFGLESPFGKSTKIFVLDGSALVKNLGTSEEKITEGREFVFIDEDSRMISASGFGLADEVTSEGKWVLDYYSKWRDIWRRLLERLKNLPQFIRELIERVIK